LRIVDDPVSNGGVDGELFMWAVETIERLEAVERKAA
jgi:hypothetical protein